MVMPFLILIGRWMALLLILSSQAALAFAQVRQTSTPITADLFTPTPLNRQQLAPTVTLTMTPTPPGPVLLEARESAGGNVNVRAAPDVNSERLGAIAFGTRYQVLRQFFLWYELRYDPAPNGKAWVFGELVEISGDISQIEVIERWEDAPAAAIDETAPDTEETPAANARVLNAPTAVEALEQVDEVIAATALPTFTYPPNFLASAATPAASPNSENENSAALPPLFPIIMLGGFGMVGLLVYSIRR